MQLRLDLCGLHPASGLAAQLPRGGRSWLAVALLVCGLLAGVGRAEAQLFGLGVSNSPSQVSVNDTLTRTIFLTNQSAIVSSAITVTNTLPTSEQFLAATTSMGLIFTNGNVISFALGQIFPFQAAQMTITSTLTQAGQHTNRVTVAVLNAPVNTNISVIRVNANSTQADLAVYFSGPTGTVFTNDWFTYGLTVSNLGPGSVSGVVLSNTLPAGVGLISVSPANLPFTLTNNSLRITLGTLPAATVTNLQFQVQPTNAGALIFLASVTASGNGDPNSTNSAAANVVTVSNFPAGQLTAVNASAMTYNPQTGLMEQKVNVTNTGTNDVAAARLMVAGLTNQLFNAVGTNNGNPFVEFDAPIAVDATVGLLLEYFVPTRLAINVPDTNYSAVPVAAPNLAPAGGTNGAFFITLMTNVPGGILIEFQSVPGRNYTVLYGTNSDLSAPLAAQPAITAQADRTQWIDDGPPKTVSPPASGSRFYRVRLNP